MRRTSGGGEAETTGSPGRSAPGAGTGVGESTATSAGSAVVGAGAVGAASAAGTVSQQPRVAATRVSGAQQACSA